MVPSVFLMALSLLGLNRFHRASGATEWPRGKFALPQPRSGCPKNWIGTRLFPESLNDALTYKDFHLAGKVNDDGIEQDFCIKKNPAGSSRWPAGRYCVLKRTACPVGLTEGYIRKIDTSTASAADADKTARAGNTGFCCSTKGNPLSPIELPMDVPFYLFAHSSAGCQKVKGSLVKEETVVVKSKDGSKMLKIAGTVPYGLNDKGLLIYCYYNPGGVVVASHMDGDTEVEKTLFTPSQFDNSAQSSGLAVAIGVGIAGAMIGTAAIAFVTKRLMTKKSEDGYDEEPRPDED